MQFYTWKFDGNIRCQVENIPQRSANKIERCFNTCKWKKVAYGRDKKDLFLMVFQSTSGPFVSVRELTDIKKLVSGDKPVAEPTIKPVIERKKGQKVCSKCGQVGHIAKTCGRKKKVKGKRICSKCGRGGHDARNCCFSGK